MNWLIARAYNGPFTNLHQAPGHSVVVYHRLLFSKLPGLTGAIFCIRGKAALPLFCDIHFTGAVGERT